jgi:hypothetical protein
MSLQDARLAAAAIVTSRQAKTSRNFSVSAQTSQTVRIALHDASAGYDFSWARLPLALLSSFSKEVEEFLRGDAMAPDIKALDTKALEVALLPGGMVIETAPLTHTALEHDLQQLLLTELLDGMSQRRSRVISRWQRQARRSPLFWVEISSGWLARPVLINAQTDFHTDDADSWVRVERYVRGQVEELGGHTHVNAHVRLADGRSLTVNASKELLAKEYRNRLYRTAMLRIRAEFHVRTWQYREAELLEFVEHDSRVDERELARLAQHGAQAWQSVGSASAWLDRERGLAP